VGEPEVPESPDRRPPRTAAEAARKAAAARFETMRQVGALGAVGMSFVLSLVIGVAIGLWLDRVTGWSPVFFIVFFLCGLAAGVLNVYRAVSRLK
jgi:ATP synthase protein I